MTDYVTFEGIANYVKPYKPDEFRGAVRWMLDLTLDTEDEVKKYKEVGIQKKLKQVEKGLAFSPNRPTTKLMKGKLVNFTPPFIYDKNGEVLVKYVDENGKPVYSYDDANKKITRVGDPVIIGNGSRVAVRMSYYDTAMGIGSRLESIKILDLIEYKPTGDDTKSDSADKVDW